MPRTVGRRELAGLDADNVVDSPRTPRTPQRAAPRTPRTPRPPPARANSYHSDQDEEGEEVPQPQRDPSPERHRSPTPRPHRDPSPERHRSPTPRPHRDPSPDRQRTPRPHRDPSPERHRSPTPRPHRDPSPDRHRSPTPRPHRDPSPDRQRTPRPHRDPSPERHRSPTPRPHRDPSPDRHRSPTPRPHRDPSPDRQRTPRPHRDPSPDRHRTPAPQTPRDTERDVRAAAAEQRREDPRSIVNTRNFREDRREERRSGSPRSPPRQPVAEGLLNLRQRRESRHTAESLGGRAPSLSPMSQDVPLVIDVSENRHRRPSLEIEFWRMQRPHESEYVNQLRHEGFLEPISIDRTRSGMCGICIEDYIDDPHERLIVRLGCAHDFHQNCIELWLAENRDCPFRCVPERRRSVELRLNQAFRSDAPLHARATLDTIGFQARAQDRWQEEEALGQGQERLYESPEMRQARERGRARRDQERTATSPQRMGRSSDITMEDVGDRHVINLISPTLTPRRYASPQRIASPRRAASPRHESPRRAASPRYTASPRRTEFSRGGDTPFIREDTVELPSINDDFVGEPGWEEDYLNRRPIRAGVLPPTGFVISEDRLNPRNFIYKRIVDVLPAMSTGYNVLLSSPSANLTTPELSRLKQYDLDPLSEHPGTLDFLDGRVGVPGKLSDLEGISLSELRWVGIAVVKQNNRQFVVDRGRAGSAPLVLAPVPARNPFTRIGLTLLPGDNRWRHRDVWFNQKIVERKYGQATIRTKARQLREMTGQAEPRFAAAQRPEPRPRRLEPVYDADRNRERERLVGVGQTGRNLPRPIEDRRERDVERPIERERDRRDRYERPERERERDRRDRDERTERERERDRRERDERPVERDRDRRDRDADRPEGRDRDRRDRDERPVERDRDADRPDGRDRDRRDRDERPVERDRDRRDRDERPVERDRDRRDRDERPVERDRDRRDRDERPAERDRDRRDRDHERPVERDRDRHDREREGEMGDREGDRPTQRRPERSYIQRPTRPPAYEPDDVMERVRQARRERGQPSRDSTL